MPYETVELLCNEDVSPYFDTKLKEANNVFRNIDTNRIPVGKAAAELSTIDICIYTYILEPEMKKVQIKICTRLRNLLMYQLQILKKPKTNIQIIQQNVLLKYKECLKFLRDNSKSVYVEIINFYSDLMNKLYQGSFKTYLSDIVKIYEEKVTKNDTIVVDESLYMNTKEYI